jgi:PAS domain S-box-containing protein
MPLRLLALVPAGRALPLVDGVDVDHVHTWEDLVQGAAKDGVVAIVVDVVATSIDQLEEWLLGDGGKRAVLVLAGASQAERLLAAGAAAVRAESSADTWSQEVSELLARARALQRRVREEERYRLMVEHTLDIVSVVDESGAFTYNSPSMEEKLGWTPEELIGRSAFDVIHEEDLEHVAETFWEAIRRPGTARALEYRVIARDGTILYLEGVGRALLGADGGFYGVINARDVTQRRHAEEAVRRSEARYRSLLEALPDAILRVDARGLVTDAYVPPTFSTTTPLGSVVGMLISEVVSAEAREQFAAAIEEVRREGTPITFVYQVPIGGIQRHREAHVVAHNDELLVVVRDKTEQARTESALRQRQALLRQVVASVPVLLFALDRQGHVTLAEGRGLQLVGGTTGSVLGSPVFELFADAPEALRVADRALRGETFSDVVEVGGRAFEVWVMALPDDPDASVIGVAVDVTEMRRQQKELESSRAELRQLAAHLQDVREEERTRISREVHDILGQSLTAIRLGVGSLGRKLGGDEEVATRVAEIQARIDETIRHVREIAAELRPGLLDDLGLASALEWQAESFARDCGITCVFTGEDPPQKLPSEINTAVFRICQEALTNVVRHAEASRVDMRLIHSPTTVVLEVADDGVGVSPQQLSRVPTLGILGMRERARILGGHLEVVGIAGAGTTVRVTFPRDTPAFIEGGDEGIERKYLQAPGG